MRNYCEARDETAVRLVILGLATLLDGYNKNNFSGKFLKKRLIKNTQYIIKNDENALPDLLTVLSSPPQDCNNRYFTGYA